MSDFHRRQWLRTGLIDVGEVCCAGRCRARSAEEVATTHSVVLTTRGVFVRHVRGGEAVAEANQLSLFTRGEPYRVSHPVAGGDECLVLAPDEEALAALLPRAERARDDVRFALTHRPLAAEEQREALLLRHDLAGGRIDDLEGEVRALDLLRRLVGREGPRVRAGASTRRLVDRAKLWLGAHAGERATLARIARDVGATPVYLTQAFAAVEREPLYRYQRRLRLARALRQLDEPIDLTTLALDCGFASHSHFTAAFRAVYGIAPSALRARGS